METQSDYQQRAQFILKKAFDHLPNLDQNIHTFYSDISKKQQPQEHKALSKNQTSLDIDQVFHMGSLSNQVYKVDLKNGNKIIVKHYFDILKDFVQRDIQHKILNIMTQKKEYPFVFYKDNFCRVEAYIPGSSISREKLNLKLLLKITQSLADFSIKYQKIKTNDQAMKLREISKAWEVYRDIYKIKLKENPQLVGKVKEFVEGVLNKKDIFINLQKLLTNHRMIMNHNDSNLSNILVLNHIQSENPEIQLLDFQFANLNYIGYDIGNLLNEIATDYGGAYSVDELGKQHKFQIRKDWQVSQDWVKQITNVYFDLVQGSQKTSWKERWRMIRIGRLLSHLFWLFVGLKQIDDPNIDLNMTYYVKRRLEEFMKLYDQIVK